MSPIEDVQFVIIVQEMPKASLKKEHIAYMLSYWSVVGIGMKGALIRLGAQYGFLWTVNTSDDVGGFLVVMNVRCFSPL